MALYVVFRKVTENDREVSYRFGHDETTLDRELTIGKADTSVTVADGRQDPIAIKVAGTVLTKYRKEGTWLAGGTLQS